MAKSDLTIEQLEAQAMLMGDNWFYDVHDHTFCSGTGGKGSAIMLDADTMQEIVWDNTTIKNRCFLVALNQIGAADHVPR